MAQKQKLTVWQERKRTIRSLLILLAVVMIAVMAVRFALDYIDFKKLIDFRNTDTPEEKYPNLYNASRYFFRIYYPDGWTVEGDNYGFIQDNEKDLIAVMYPNIDVDVTAADGTVSKQATRDTVLTAKFYYREYTDEERAAVSAVLAEVTPNPSSVITGENDLISSHLNPGVVAVVAENVYAEYTEKTANYTDIVMSELKEYKTGDILFKYFTFSYIEKVLSPEIMDFIEITHSVDVYIAARSINYVIITYDGELNIQETTRNGYTIYRKQFLDILEEFRFSVFED